MNVNGACVVAKYCTPIGMAKDCLPRLSLLHLLVQRKFPRRDTVGILEREEETPQAVVSLRVSEVLPGTV
jgi:hypothetical protein